MTPFAARRTIGNVEIDEMRAPGELLSRQASASVTACGEVPPRHFQTAPIASRS